MRLAGGTAASPWRVAVPANAAVIGGRLPAPAPDPSTVEYADRSEDQWTDKDGTEVRLTV